MDRISERCAGLDVHKDSITACVRVPGEKGQRHQETRTFATTTRSLLALHDWLSSFGITLVGMESTGVYWKAVVRREGATYPRGDERSLTVKPVAAGQ